MMPKGVDHIKTRDKEVLDAVNVQKSLMPKGVDHKAYVYESSGLPDVQKSLMPKGVDHSWRKIFSPRQKPCKNL